MVFRTVQSSCFWGPSSSWPKSPFNSSVYFFFFFFKIHANRIVNCIGHIMWQCGCWLVDNHHQWKYWYEIRHFGSKSLVQNGFPPTTYLTDIFDITETNTASMPACWGLALMRTKMRKTWLRLPWCWRQERKSSGLTSTPSLTFSLTLLEEHPMRDLNATRWVPCDSPE